MSLLGALSLGGSSLAAQQAGLQVTGNNIANAGTEGYTRQTVRLTSNSPTELIPGQFIGNGVGVGSIERQANAAINDSLRDATSNQSSAQTLDTLLGRVETTFGALNDTNLSTRINDFLSSFSTLANNPGDMAQRSVVTQTGASVANYLQDLRSQLSAIRDDAQSQVSALVTQADTLVKSIANLNSQIAVSEGGSTTGGNSALRDQRDLALTQLSQIMDIKVYDQGGGQLSVLVGSVPVVSGAATRGVSSAQVTDPTNTFTNTQVVFSDNQDPMNISGGKLGALINARNSYLTPAIQAVDSMAAGLISAVNSIHSQGQGTTGFTSLTGITSVSDPTAALNAGLTATGIAFPPQNGTFNLLIQDTVTGQTTTRQITVNLSGQGTQDSLNSLAASITAAGGGVINASVTAGGKLSIASNNNNVTFGFSEDASGTLAALGINTFFTGKDASNIAVNSVINNDPTKLAAAHGSISNANAQALALAGKAAVSQLNGKSLTDYYTDYISTLSSHAKNASDDVVAQNTIHDTIFAQQQAISGVSLDEEAINLTKYQRAFQGTARFISVVDELMQTVLGLVH